MTAKDSPPTAEAGQLTFSSFRLDLRGGQLICGGRAVPLRPKTWAVLRYLAERPGVLVTREELLNAVWPDVVVTPDTLTKSIGELRLALKDDSKTPRCIETVHRRGFRFIAVPRGPSPGTPGREGWSDSVPNPRLFIGRDAELRQLEDRLAKASAGERQLVFVSGSTGIGKTALVEAFLDLPALRQAGRIWVGRGSCLEHHGPREAYMPMLEALERLARQPQAGALVTHLRRAAPTWIAQMPWLMGDDAEALHRALHAARAERMLREFGTFVEAVTAEVTLVFVLEDLHWCDPSTVDLLAFLFQRREPARLLVLASYRPADLVLQEHPLASAARTLHSRGQAVELPMHDLSVSEVRGYLAARFPGATFPRNLAQLIHAHTDGNPLFMVSVVDLMVTSGKIIETAPGWVLSTAPEHIDLGIPDDVRRMIELQVSGLPPADRELVEVASVGGVEFAPSALTTALGCTVSEVEARCETLARAGRFLRAAGSAEWPDGSVVRSYAFCHELYRHGVYAEIPDGRRVRLHRQIGEMLEAAYGARATEVAPELAVHFEKSRDHARALTYLAAAAARARRRCANAEALAYLEPALALARRLPEQHERLRRELDLRMALGPVLSDLQGYASELLRENYERADILSERVGTVAEQFAAVYALCHFHAARANAAEVDTSMRRLDALAGRVGTAAASVSTDSALVRIAVVGGRLDEACTYMEQRLPRHRRRDVAAPRDFGPDPVIDAISHYAFALWLRGQPEQARSTAHANRVAARSSGVHSTLVAALALGACVELFSGRLDEALAWVEEAILVCDENGFPFWRAICTGVRGCALARRGDERGGLAELERARVALGATGARAFSTHILAFQAEAHLRVGAVEAGLASIDEAVQLVETTFDRTYRPEVWRLRGELLLAARAQASPAPRRGKRAAPPLTAERQEGEHCLVHALDLARESSSKSLELRAATSLARVWRERGRTKEARRLLAEICEWFGDGSASPDLVTAHEQLDRLGTAA